MDPSLPAWGDMQTLAVTVRQFKISSRVCSRFKPLGLRAFAAILEDGSVVTWGDLQTSMVVTVRQFEISSRVCSKFKPLIMPLLRFWKMDPSLPGVHAGYGGDSSAVRDQLKGVQQIQATSEAFAAILEDGSVVTWGHARLWR